VGRILRQTSLDELPQLINVVRGEMSLVGPRPTSFAPSTYSLWHTYRLEVAPGITGLWQVKGRNKTDFDERLRLDIEYMRHRSFALDLKILLQTVPAVLGRSGA
jgi:lipopolysaccharide/colanic/teichoic acid biosynthesis glycosyltransferase